METKKNNLFKNRIGEIHITNEGYRVIIIEYFGAKNCSIMFENNIILYNKEYKDILRGEIKNPFHPSVFGIGYIGVGEYKVWKEGKNTRVYNIWNSMMTRCYSDRYQKIQPTYKGCSVDERWHNFQVFGDWYKENFNIEYMDKWHLDKDILQKGNKIYSPETCCFVPNDINSLLVKRDKERGDLPTGVKAYYKKFLTRISKKGKLIHLGIFSTIREAFECYKFHKEQYIKELADKWKDKITDQVYQALVNYNVEIID